MTSQAHDGLNESESARCGLPMNRRQWTVAALGWGTTTTLGLGMGQEGSTAFGASRPEGPPTLSPGSDDYEKTLHGLFNGTSAAAEPAGIVQPRTLDDVSHVVNRAREARQAITVRGGGHSQFCAANDRVMIDLSRHMAKVEPDGDLVHVMGGASMGGVLRSLAPLGRFVPVGTHATPGFGLLTQGGIGHLSRGHGFTVECIVSLEGVRGDGTPFSLRETDPGLDKELWACLRGGAPFLGIVTRATLRTYPRKRLKHWRGTFSLDCADELIEVAESLPHGCSCSLVFGPCPDGLRQIMAFAVAPTDDEEGMDAMMRLPDRIGKVIAQKRLGEWSGESEGLEDLPPFDIPATTGALPESPRLNRTVRPQGRIFSPLLGAGHWRAGLGRIVSRFIREAPGPLCRVDFQQTGPAIDKGPTLPCSFRGRESEWGPVITGLGRPGMADETEKSIAWADSLWSELKPFANGYYIVQNHPGTAHYEDELTMAFGTRLPALRKWKQAWDPNSQLHPLS